jgi:hypothetical protein
MAADGLIVLRQIGDELVVSLVAPDGKPSERTALPEPEAALPEPRAALPGPETT